MSWRELAAIARRAENEFAGVPSGIMDQSASLLCEAGHALLLDCQSLEASQVPFDPAAARMIVPAICWSASPGLRRPANTWRKKIQPMNASEPCSIERFNGKEYICSVSMAYAARHFMDRARLLESEGCKIYVHGSGYLPDMWNTKLSEPEKYRLMWEQPEYRVYAPGEHCVDEFLHVVKPNKGDRVIDFGCGTGRAALKLHDAGLDVTLVDFASGCRDSEALGLPFVEADLTRPLALSAPYGFCTDVLEHIPPEDVQTVIKNIMRAAGTVYFQISTVPDVSGALIGAQLHLTVKPHAWWGSLFESLGYHVAYEREEKTASVFVIQKGRI